MANSTITFKLSHRWIKEDPDGQECVVCGDTCYLFPPRRLKVTVHPIGSSFEMDGVICNSCLDATP